MEIRRDFGTSEAGRSETGSPAKTQGPAGPARPAGAHAAKGRERPIPQRLCPRQHGLNKPSALNVRDSLHMIG
jgi:hypothetical protein